MRLKDDTVDIRGVHNDIVRAWFVLDRLWRKELGYELVITSGRDAVHNHHSRHYIGCASDLRTWKSANDSTQITGAVRTALLRKAKEGLEGAIPGVEYALIDEEERAHFHLQLARTSL